MRFCLERAVDGRNPAPPGILQIVEYSLSGINYQPQLVLGKISEPSSLCHLSTLYKLIAPGAMFFRSLGAFFSTLAPQDSESTGESLPRPKVKSEFTLEKWWESKTIRLPIGFR